MVKIDCLIFGYRKIKIDPSDLSFVTSLLLRSSIPTGLNNDGTVTVRERDFARIQSIFEGRVNYTASETLGIYGKLKGIKYKKTVIFSFAFSLILALILSGLIWDIRVEGNDKIPSSKIVYQLSKCGFDIGDWWMLTDRSKVEAEMLMKMDKLSWININKRGTVAYVKVIERDEDDTNINENPNGYSNIVASTDCVIEEITLVSGYAVVKPGDTVKKGDLLISGIVPSESGVDFCRAQGKVIGRLSESINTSVDREHKILLQRPNKLYSLEIKIFNFSINIFKLYGNLTNECDIIETEKAFSLFGEYKLPFSITAQHIPVYETETESYTDDEIVLIASSRLNALIASRLVSCDLIGIRTYGGFTDSGYEMSSDIVFLAEVGKQVEFSVE